MDITFRDLKKSADLEKFFILEDPEWVPLIFKSEDKKEYLSIQHALVDTEVISQYMKEPDWGNSSLSSWSGNVFNFSVTYSRSPANNEIDSWHYPEDIRPLLFYREFYDLRDN
jgi:hypothetical protein